MSHCVPIAFLRAQCARCYGNDVATGLLDFRLTRHEKIDDDVDRVAVVNRKLTVQLKAPQTFPLFIAVIYQEGDQAGVLSVSKCFCVQPEINVEGANMRHVLIVQQQPGNGAADDGELPFEATPSIWPISMRTDFTARVVRSS
jgi:hypothetical protein